MSKTRIAVTGAGYVGLAHVAVVQASPTCTLSAIVDPAPAAEIAAAKAGVPLYKSLAELTPSPIVELNRAVALAFADGPGTALALVDTLRAEPSLKAYPLLPGVRGDLLFRLGRLAEAEVLEPIAS